MAARLERVSVALHFHQRGGVELEAFRYANWLDRQERLGVIFCLTSNIVLAAQTAGHLSGRIVFLKTDSILSYISSLFLINANRSRAKSRLLVIHSWRDNWQVSQYFLMRLAGFRIHLIEHQWEYEPPSDRSYLQTQVLRYSIAYGVGVSSGALEILANSGLPESRIALSWNGTDVHQFTDNRTTGIDFRANLGIHSETILFAYVGRLAKYKNVDAVIHSYSEFKQSNFSTDSKLLLIGDGPERNRLEQKTRKLGLQEDVLFLGWISNPEDVLPAVDILILLSQKESCPLVAIEAMSCGCAVVCVDAGDLYRLTQGLGGVVVLPKGETRYEIPKGFVRHYLDHKLQLRKENRCRVVKCCNRHEVYRQYLLWPDDLKNSR